MREKMAPGPGADAANRPEEFLEEPVGFKGADLTHNAAARFQQQIYRYFHQYGRQLPWRLTRDPFHILVSEIMLQQTSVERVQLRYAPFLAAFPDVASLARAPLAEVMAAWQGLGYNRRALALQQIAQRLMAEFGGRLPEAVETLRTLPGIGPATAGALAAFAFEQPVAFIETNIRRVFIHCFFAGKHGIRDQEILPLVAQTLDREQPRAWYYALMDYGAGLKRPGSNPNRRSAHYQRQSPFTGSDRQIRGLILKTVLAAPALSLTAAALAHSLGKNPIRTQSIIAGLIREGFLEQVDGHVRIATGPGDLS